MIRRSGCVVLSPPHHDDRGHDTVDVGALTVGYHSDKQCQINRGFTDLQPGERMDEELMGTSELDKGPLHPMISHVPAPPLNPADVDSNSWVRSASGLRKIGAVPRLDPSVVGPLLCAVGPELRPMCSDT